MTYFQTGGHSNGLVQTSVNTDNHTTTMSYDTSRRLIGTVDALNRHTTITYDSVGNTATTSDPKGLTTTTVLDVRNRLTAETTPLNETATTLFDAAGRNVTETIDAKGIITQNSFNVEGWLTSVAVDLGQPDVETTSYSPDAAGNVTVVTDPRGKTTKTDFDVVNQPIKVTDALNLVTTLLNDPTGNVTETINRTASRITLASTR